MRTKLLGGAFALLALTLAGGCSTVYLSPAASHALANIKVGMTRDEIVRQLGPPHAQETIGNTELLTYRADWTAESTEGNFSPIAIVDNKVVGFGSDHALKVKFDYEARTVGK